MEPFFEAGNLLFEAEDIILSTRREAENLIADIRSSQANRKSIKKTKKQLNQKLNQLQNQGQDFESESRPLSKKDALKGAHVYITKLNRSGKILVLPNDAS